ncbi:MAG: M20/M25/M40 family metallo-hydrolase [Vicinamibacterales bacterium]
MTRTDAVALVHGLVAVPSLSRQEAAAVRWLVAQMEGAGYDRAFVDGAGNAVGEIGPADAARVIVLLGHIDTVPGNIPVRLARGAVNPVLAGAGSDDATGDVLFGRGSVDAKGPLAAFVAAVAGVGSARAHAANVRIVVVGAVEEEAATSRGARFVAERFNGRDEPVPAACIIGEPSHWHRVTLGYKGRLLVDLAARQSMTHTAGPEQAVAEVVVDLWNWVRRHADEANAGVDRPFDQLSPSLRRFITGNVEGLTDTVDAQFAWRLPLGLDAQAFANEVIAAVRSRLGAGDGPGITLTAGDGGQVCEIGGARTHCTLTFRGYEPAWKGEKSTPLVRAFLAATRQARPGAQPGFVVKTGTSDMNVVGPVWRCPIVAYGPGDSALDHTPEEHLELDEYWLAVRVLQGWLTGLFIDD